MPSPSAIDVFKRRDAGEPWSEIMAAVGCASNTARRLYARGAEAIKAQRGSGKGKGRKRSKAKKS